MQCPKCQKQMMVEAIDEKTKRARCTCGESLVLNQQGKQLLTGESTAPRGRPLRG